MKKFAKSLTLALTGLAMAGAAISPALAAGPADPMTLKIATADINLATAQGQRTLDRRIEKAARSVCRADDRSTGTRIMNQDARTCLDKVRAEARQQVAALNRIEQRGA